MENKLIETLIDLKENHHILGVKAEFEDEGASFEEIVLLRNLVQKAGMDLTIKIGGCGALNDINQAKKLGTVSIVAPMIESDYALKKFVQSVKNIYAEEINMPELHINIETISGYNNFDEIILASEVQDLAGVVVGRFDMAKSIGLECKDCNGEKLFEIVNDLAIKTKKTGKIFTVGGGVSVNSLDFFSRISGELNKFETRKIIFDANYSLRNNDTDGILKAIEFEMQWLNLKREVYGIINSKDFKRLETLKKRAVNFVGV